MVANSLPRPPVSTGNCPNRELIPAFTVWISRFVTKKKVSPVRDRNPAGATNVRSSSPRKLYSTFADQLGAKAHSMPTPTSQPLLLLLEVTIDAPVVRLVIVKSSLPTQPAPALP